MRCTSPRTVGYSDDGRTLSWSQKSYSKEFATFQLPCGKCIACRLERGRQWAVRATHEASIHPYNAFITLTYSDDALVSDRLIYAHFQSFMKRLRSELDYKGVEHQIGVLAVGEYGEQRKRPHFHACLFGWRPHDAVYEFSTDRGDKVFRSKFLDEVWGFGDTKVGDVTFDSAGYCARYAAKKLVHGKDHEHDYNPIFRVSSKYAIGKRWLERFWPDVFNYGKCTVHKGAEIIETGIPRYYEKWFKENHPDRYLKYLSEVKGPMMLKAQELEARDLQFRLRDGGYSDSKNKVEAALLNYNFNRLQERLKL